MVADSSEVRDLKVLPFATSGPVRHECATVWSTEQAQHVDAGRRPHATGLRRHTSQA